MNGSFGDVVNAVWHYQNQGLKLEAWTAMAEK
jgi:hypothetical protein